jgi:hypothetical protein
MNLLEQRTRIRQDFLMDEQGIRSCPKKGVHKLGWMIYHQMHLQRQPRHPPQALDDRRPHAEVGNKVSVHDIDMDSLGASFFNLEDLLAQSSKIRGQDRWSDVDHGVYCSEQ